jgi:hypothetical protein
MTVTEHWVQHPDPAFRHPDPSFHHSFCSFVRYGDGCSCAEGRQTRQVGHWLALDPVTQDELEADLLDLPAEAPKYAYNVVVRSGRTWHWMKETP